MDWLRKLGWFLTVVGPIYKIVDFVGNLDFVTKLIGHPMPELGISAWVLLIASGTGILILVSNHFYAPPVSVVSESSTGPVDSQIEIEYSGKPPHRDTVLNQDVFRLAARNKSKTADAKSVNLWLSEVTSISGWNHNIGEQRLQQYGDMLLEQNGYRVDATLTPDQARDYSFISRWREHEGAITLWLAVMSKHTLPHGQYTMTVKATASGSIPRYRKFLVGISNKNALTMEPLGPSFVKPPS